MKKKLLSITKALALSINVLAQTSASLSNCSADITTGLVAQYDFTSNANDLSGNSNNAIMNNGSTFGLDRFGNLSSSAQLDGVNDYIALPSGSSNSLNITGDFTVSFWLKSSDNSGGLAAIGNSVTSPYQGYVSALNGGNVGNGKIGISTNGTWTGSVNSVSDNNWHNITYILKSDTLKLYIDNVLDKQVTGILPPLSWNGIRVLGCRTDLVMSSATNFGGLLDDIRIYNRALTTCDLDSLYNLPNCASLTASITLTGSASFCLGDSVLLTATSASSYLWSNGATTQSIIVKASGSDSVTITASNGCVLVSSPTIVTVHPLPTVALSALSSVCSDSSAFTLTGGTPIGGTYSGIGVSSNMFSASIAGVGTFPITYVYADGNSCTDSATQNLTVNSCLSSSQCYSTPDGTNGNSWSYKDYVIPTGYKLDSVFMDATRPGYPANNHDFVFESCQGTTTFNNSSVTYPFNYNTENNSLYSTWIDLTSFNYISVGMVRVSLPTNAGAIWNQLCFAISPAITTGLNPSEIESSISIYPNPTLGVISIKGITNETVVVFNSIGQIILQSQKVNTIDLSSNDKGVYFIQIMNEKGNIVRSSKIFKE